MSATGHTCGEPQSLIKLLIEAASYLKEIEITHMVPMEPAEYTQPQYQSIFRHNTLFVGSGAKKTIEEGRVDYTPYFFRNATTFSK